MWWPRRRAIVDHPAEAHAMERASEILSNVPDPIDEYKDINELINKMQFGSTLMRVYVIRICTYIAWIITGIICSYLITSYWNA